MVLDKGAIPAQEWTALADWVASGHQLLLLGGSPNLKGKVQTNGLEFAQAAAVHPATAGLTKVAIGRGFFKTLDQPAQVLLADGAAHAVLVAWPHGKGQILWSADTDWLTNAKIGEAQNLDLAMALLRPGPGMQVGFDEYHHGFRGIEHWWQILRGPLLLFMLQLLLALLLFYWASGARFGKPRPRPAIAPRAAVEYVAAMSHLYARARARGLVVQALYQDLHRSLGHLLGGVRGLDHAEIAHRAALRTGLPPAAIQTVLDGLAAGGAPPDSTSTPPSEAELLTLARQAAELQRSVRHAGFRDQQPAAPDRR